MGTDLERAEQGLRGVLCISVNNKRFKALAQGWAKVG